MSRVFRAETGAQRRNKCLKQMAAALRRATEDSLALDEQRDVLAFIAERLTMIVDSVEETVGAWEKRDYWVKAERFRRQWLWAKQSRDDLESALRAGQLEPGIQSAVQLATHLDGVRPGKRQGSAAPWRGAWERYQQG